MGGCQVLFRSDEAYLMGYVNPLPPTGSTFQVWWQSGKSPLAQFRNNS
jgi:hypothetical protein